MSRPGTGQRTRRRNETNELHINESKQRNRNVEARNVVILSSSSDDDNIKVLPTKNSSDKVDLIEIHTSSDEYDNEYGQIKGSGNWEPKNKRNIDPINKDDQIVDNSSEKKQNEKKKVRRRVKTEEHVEAEVEGEKECEAPGSEENGPNDKMIESRKDNKERDDDSVPKHFKRKTKYSANSSAITTIINCPQVEIEKYVPEPIPEDIQSFTVIRTKSLFKGNTFKFLAGEKKLYETEYGEDELNKIHKIFRKDSVTKTYSDAGFIRVHELSHRFTIACSIKKPNDDRDGELLGCFFSKVPEGRRLRIAMTRDGRPFYPITHRLNLSRVSKEENKDTRFLYFEAIHKPDDTFGSDIVVKSIKNFKVTDPENGKFVFQLLKIADDQFSISISSPLDLMTGFGLSVAVISSSP